MSFSQVHRLRLFLLALPLLGRVGWGEFKLIFFCYYKKIKNILFPPHPTLSLWRGLKASLL